MKFHFTTVQPIWKSKSIITEKYLIIIKKNFPINLLTINHFSSVRCLFVLISVLVVKMSKVLDVVSTSIYFTFTRAMRSQWCERKNKTTKQQNKITTMMIISIHVSMSGHRWIFFFSFWSHKWCGSFPWHHSRHQCTMHILFNCHVINNHNCMQS